MTHLGFPLVDDDFFFFLELVMQEGLAAVFGNGLSTACVVNMGAQVTSVICVEVTAIRL